MNKLVTLRNLEEHSTAAITRQLPAHTFKESGEVFRFSSQLEQVAWQRQILKIHWLVKTKEHDKLNKLFPSKVKTDLIFQIARGQSEVIP